MGYMLYGAAGVVGVLLLLCIGAIVGWKSRLWYEKHNRKVVLEQLTEEQKAKFVADQNAFEAMINYTTDMAYGNIASIEDLGK